MPIPKSYQKIIVPIYFFPANQPPRYRKGAPGMWRRSGSWRAVRCSRTSTRHPPRTPSGTSRASRRSPSPASGALHNPISQRLLFHLEGHRISFSVSFSKPIFLMAFSCNVEISCLKSLQKLKFTLSPHPETRTFCFMHRRHSLFGHFTPDVAFDNCDGLITISGLPSCHHF